jgi:cell division protein FtsA
MESYNEQNGNVVVAVDIGTTKICAIAGRLNEYSKLEVLAMSKVESTGVNRGVVANIEKTVQGIKEAVESIERKINADVHTVYVGIAGQHIKSLRHRGILTRDDAHSEIGKADIEKLIKDMYRLVLPPGDRILHVIPQEFTIDNEPGIIDPIGFSGVRLEANFHIVTAQDTALTNLQKCFERANLKIADTTLEPIASSYSVLTDEEREAGVALVDIGGGTTDLTIFHEGILRHSAVIPFGGNVVTRDIKEGCTVMDKQAEKLKIKFGSALSEEVFDNLIITIPGFKGRDSKEISERNLALIIQARMEEIMDCVYSEIRKSGFEKKLIGGLVLTGGGSMLKHMDLLTEYVTGIQTRIGHPIEHLAHGYPEQLSSPIYATAIGLLIKGLANADKSGVTFRPAKQVQTERKKEEVLPGFKTTFPTEKTRSESENDFFNIDFSSESDTGKAEEVDSWKNESVVEVAKKISRPKAVKDKADNQFAKPNFFERIFNETKRFLEATPDNDFK